MSRNEMRDEVLKTHEIYQKAITAIGMAVYQLDFATDTYQNTNLEILEELIGAKYEGSHRDQWKGIEALDLQFHGDLAGLPIQEARRRYETGEAPVWRCEFKIKTRDGSVKWLYDVALPVRDEEGNITGSFGILRDVTEFRQSAELHRSLVAVLAEGILVKDRDGIIQSCNPAAQKILRLSEDKILGRRIGTLDTDIVSLDGLRGEELCTGGEQTGLICALRYADGSLAWVSVNALPIDDGDLVVSFTDITARFEAQEQLKKVNADLEQAVADRTRELQTANSELESFAYSVSHDLRQPLRSIDGFARILELDCGEQLNEEAIDYIARIRTSTRRMSTLIDDLLRLSRLISHELHFDRLDITNMTREAFETIRNHSERKVDFSVEEGLTAVGDRSLVMAVLDNLLGNAWKFTSKREETVIRVGQKDGAFFVQDNGEGFDMKYSNKLFQPFQRLHSPSEFEGTGIGLATVRRIIERHKGTVWADSAVGEGTTVFFTLPSK